MAGSRTSVLELVIFVLHELVLELVLEPVQKPKFWKQPFVSDLRNVQELHFFLELQLTGTSTPIIPKFQGNLNPSFS